MEQRTDRIAALERLIVSYQRSYYNGEAEISDAEFDLLWDELKSLHPKSPVLAKVGKDDGGFPKAKHLIPMGSQEKAANPEEFLQWAEKISALGDFGGFVVQYKLDGASLELQYKNGILLKAVTRGDGVTGDEITSNARAMKGVVEKLKDDFSGGVRGEVIMTHDVWQKKYRDKANCRNAANGLMRRKDGKGSEDLSFITYDACAPDNDDFFVNEAGKISWLERQGFAVIPLVETANPGEIIAYREKIASARDTLPFDIDGLVIKDKTTDPADLRRARPERQIAFKFVLETAFSVLRDVEWSESGATYTPIGVIDPVRLAGTTVQRANLNNPDMIRAMGLKIGKAVSVVKRGEIIPKIEGLAPDGALPAEHEQEIVFPDTCGTCGTALEDGGTRLFCPNPGCQKKLHHRLEKWAGVLDIRELGDKLLRQLFDKKRVMSVAALYTLTAEELALYERMGKQSAEKVIRHIMTPREMSLAGFVAGFDFEGVGELIMERVASSGYNTLERLRSAAVEDLARIWGIGTITAETIVQGLRDAKEDMDNVLASGVISIAAPPREEDLPLLGLSFCFTGELKTMKRSAAEEKIKLLGAALKSSVVKDLSYLVTNDTESGTAKNKKARDLGIPIIDEDQFRALLEKSGPAPPA
ncbi:MAG: NAD-dependent DNA ligase LigA [Treponema sp.]|jgi:DNA ligase (NAD+)|nr:NAD-dependent DNA ligase LigA [Treponema sp.]